MTLALNFVVRTYFINILGTSNLGINGLSTNILSVLSLSKLRPFIQNKVSAVLKIKSK